MGSWGYYVVPRLGCRLRLYLGRFAPTFPADSMVNRGGKCASRSIFLHVSILGLHEAHCGYPFARCTALYLSRAVCGHVSFSRLASCLVAPSEGVPLPAASGGTPLLPAACSLRSHESGDLRPSC
eukprot:14877952-Heterocapsa_arctica.AAC.1